MVDQVKAIKADNEALWKDNKALQKVVKTLWLAAKEADSVALIEDYFTVNSRLIPILNE